MTNEQARKNKLRIKLIKEAMKDKSKYKDNTIKEILREPDAYLKRQMLNKFLVQDNPEFWNGHEWVKNDN